MRVRLKEKGKKERGRAQKPLPGFFSKPLCLHDKSELGEFVASEVPFS